MIVDSVTPTITTITNSTGSGTEQTSSFTLPSNSIIVIPIANYSINHADGHAVYTIDGGSEVSFGPPILNQGSLSNDKVCFFATYVAVGGTCVVKVKNCSYDFAPPIVLTGSSHFKITFSAVKEDNFIAESPASSGNFPVTTNGLTPVWNTEIPANITVEHSSKVAIAIMTHGPDTGVPVITADGAWTVRDQANDYDGLFQPALVMYQQVPDNDPVVGTITVNQSFRYTFTQIIVEDSPDVYRVQGGGNPAKPKGYFGHEGEGGADHIATIVFDPPLKAGMGVTIPISNYNRNTLAADITDDGGNTWTRDEQDTYNSNSGDGAGASISLISSVLTSDLTTITYADGGSGDAGGYGQLGAYVFKNPDTVNGFFGSSSKNSQKSVSTIAPGTVTPTTNLGFFIFCGNNRGHSPDFRPFTMPSGYGSHLYHPGIDQDGAESAVHNSTTQSGWWFGKAHSAYTAETPTFGFAAGTGEARSIVAVYNILGGVVDAGGGGFSTVFGSKVFSSGVFRG